MDLDALLNWVGCTDINASNDAGYTPLQLAVLNERCALVEIFLKCGADINIKGEQGRTALSIAITQVLPDIVQLLLDYGANLNDINNSGKSALRWALDVRYRGTEYLAEFNSQMSTSSFNPLSYLPPENRKTRTSEHQGDISHILDMLLLYGTCLGNARQSYYYHICEAIITGDVDSVKKWLGKFNDDVDFRDIGAESPLEFAVLLKELKIAELLLKRNGNPNQDRALRRESVLIHAINANSVEMVRLLLKFGASVNFTSFFNQTPLYFSTFNVGLMKILIEHEAKLNTFNNGETVLHKVCRLGLVDAAICLIQHSSNLSIRDNFGRNTPLHYGIREFEITKRLVEGGGADVNAVNAEGQTPLHLACWNGSKKSVELLVNHGAKLDLTDVTKRTVLHYAIGDFEKFDYLADLTIDSGLLSINARDAEGFTVLHHYGCLKLSCQQYVEVLKRGIDINLNFPKESFFAVHRCRDTADDPYFYSGCANVENDKCPAIEYMQRLRMLGYKFEFFEQLTNFSGLKYDTPRELAEIYKEEFENLKKKIISWNPQKSLYDIFFAKRNWLARNVDNENWIQDNVNFEKEFPYFGNVLKSQYYKALNRKKCADLAENRLKEVFGFGVPLICVDLILTYLNSDQLKNCGTLCDIDQSVFGCEYFCS